MANTTNVGITVPAELANAILHDAFEASAVGQLTGATPIPLSGSTVPVYDGSVEAGLVAEGGTKSVSTFKATTKSITPAKLATIVVVSKELVELDPAGIMSVVQADLVNSISRGIDSLVLHGKDLRGNTYAGANVSVVGDGNHEVELDGTETAAEYAEALTEAYMGAADGSDPNAWLFDSRLRAKNAQAVAASNGELPNLAAGATVVAGLPAVYGRAVDAGTGTKGVVGDWSKVRFGYVTGIEVQRSTEAMVGDVNLFTSNQIALLVEARIGWTTLDRSAFSVLAEGEDGDEG